MQQLTENKSIKLSKKALNPQPTGHTYLLKHDKKALNMKQPAMRSHYRMT